MLTTTQREQIEQLIKRLEANNHRHLDEILMEQLLDPIELPRYKANREIVQAEQYGRYRELVGNFPVPGNAYSYSQHLSVFLRQHGTMSNRLPSLYEKRDALQARINAHERFLDEGPKQAWRHYDGLSEEAKLWCADEPAERTDTNQPPRWDTAPLAVVLPDEQSWRVKSQLEALRRSLIE